MARLIVCHDTDEVVYCYAQYLGTIHWKVMKNKKDDETGGRRCLCCGTSRNVDLHHISYERLGNEALSDLAWLCRRCHEQTHQYNFDWSGWPEEGGITNAARMIIRRCESRVQ